MIYSTSNHIQKKHKKNSLLKHYFLCIIIGFSSYLVSSQSKTPINDRYLDSVISTLDTVPTNLKKIKKLVRIAGINRYTTPTRRLIDKALEISNRVNEPYLNAQSYYSLGNYYFFNSQLDSCLLSLGKAYQYSEEINEPLLQSSILSTKGGAYRKLGAMTLSISTAIGAKNILDKIDTLTLNKKERRKFKGQNLVLNNSLANLYNDTEDFEKALLFYDSAYNAALNLGSFGNAGVILSNKGDLLIKIGKLAEGLALLKQGKEMKIKGAMPKRMIANSDLAIGEAHFAMKNYDEALANYNKSLEVSTQIKSSQGIMKSLTMLGILSNSQKNPLKAQEYCNQAKSMAKQMNDSEFIMKSCDCLYEAYNKLGNYKASLQNHELFNRIKDSVFNEKNIRKITQVGMQYDFDKKEAEQQLILQEKNRQKNQILTGLIAIGIFALMLLAFFKKRLKYQRTIAQQTEDIQQQKITDLQQKNKLLAMSSMIEGQEAERLRIAKDLHDSLGGLLSTVKAHFSTIQKEIEPLGELNLTGKTNDLIDEACLEVRRISHNMMPHALSISGLKGALEDMGEHLNAQGYSTTVEINGIPEDIESTKEVMVYRLVQEIVSNIRKHAAAKNILIQLFGHKNELNLIVEDDGSGFLYKEALDKGGLGLKSINSRVEFLDGNIQWDSQPEKGTSITINIPVK